MGICTMFRKCENCGHRYTYNPSTGNFGKVCPRCRTIQSDFTGTVGRKKVVERPEYGKFLTTAPVALWWLTDKMGKTQKRKQEENNALFF